MMTAKMQPGEGERAERGRRNRLFWTVAAMMIAGGITGYAVALSEGEGGFLKGSMPPELAILLTAIFLFAVILGSVNMVRGMDEYAMSRQISAMAWGGGIYMLVYPAWFLLWKGRLLPEPHHLVLFAIAYIGVVLGCLVRIPKFNRNI